MPILRVCTPQSIAGELHRIERTVEKAVMPIPDGKGSYRRYAAPNEPLVRPVQDVTHARLCSQMLQRDLIRNRIVNDVGELVCSESVSSDQRRLRAEVESLHESNRLNEEAYRKALADKDAFIDALEKGDDVEHTLVLLKACRQNNARMRKELEICTKGKNAMMRSAVKFEQLARERAAEVANVTSLWNNARTELANTELEFTEAKRRLGQQVRVRVDVHNTPTQANPCVAGRRGSRCRTCLGFVHVRSWTNCRRSSRQVDPSATSTGRALRGSLRFANLYVVGRCRC